MSESDFLSVEKDETARFVLLRSVARQDYVVARIALVNGLTDAGCLMAHQSLEMILKAIISLDHKRLKKHDLTQILRKYEHLVPCAKEILENPRMVHFLANLLRVYTLMRYGEGRFTVNEALVAELLDELFFKLDEAYAKKLKGEAQGLLYVPTRLQTGFLKDNRFFTSTKITDNPLGLIAFPVSNLPEPPT